MGSRFDSYRESNKRVCAEVELVLQDFVVATLTKVIVCDFEIK